MSRTKSACVDTSFSTQSEPRPLAASSSSLSTRPTSSRTLPARGGHLFAHSSTRSLVALIRSAAASTSGVKFRVSGVTFGLAGGFAADFLAGGFATTFLAFAADFLANGFAGDFLAFAADFLAGALAAAFLAVPSPRRSWLVP